MNRIEDRVISRKYKNSTGENKNKVRRRVNNYILESDIEYPLILSLPGEHWTWERELLNLIPSARFIGVEQDSNISYKATLNSVNIISSIVAVYNETLSKVLNSSPTNSLSHIIMDYCCTINSVVDEINYTLANDIVVKNGIIAITLSKINIQPNTLIRSVSNSIPRNVLQFEGSNSTVATKLIMSHIIINNLNYKLIDVIEYYDTSAMIVFVVKRIK